MPKDESTQYTPQGLEIPIPTRGQIDDALAKVSKPVASGKRKRRPKKK
jgi:hypothetical protein